MTSAFISGVSHGNIGHAVAKRLARNGISLFLTDIRPHVAEIAESLSAEFSVTCTSEVANLREQGIRDALIARAFDVHGDLSVLINCAGISRPTKPLDITPQEWAEVYGINTETMFFCCQSFIRHLIDRDRAGSVVNVSSMAGRTGGTHNGLHYASSKAAIIAFTRGLGRAFGKNGIRVNAVAPGIIDTPMSHAVAGSNEQAKSAPIARWGTVEEVAESIVFLAGPGASYITGTTLDVNGGLV